MPYREFAETYAEDPKAKVTDNDFDVPVRNIAFEDSSEPSDTPPRSRGSQGSTSTSGTGDSSVLGHKRSAEDEDAARDKRAPGERVSPALSYPHVIVSSNLKIQTLYSLLLACRQMMPLH